MKKFLITAAIVLSCAVTVVPQASAQSAMFIFTGVPAGPLHPGASLSGRISLTVCTGGAVANFAGLSFWWAQQARRIHAFQLNSRVTSPFTDPAHLVFCSLTCSRLVWWSRRSWIRSIGIPTARRPRQIWALSSGAARRGNQAGRISLRILPSRFLQARRRALSRSATPPAQLLASVAASRSGMMMRAIPPRSRHRLSISLSCQSRARSLSCALA